MFTLASSVNDVHGNDRVVVTGIGAVSPNGIGREAFWEATKTGRSGVAITRLIPRAMQPKLPARYTASMNRFM